MLGASLGTLNARNGLLTALLHTDSCLRSRVTVLLYSALAAALFLLSLPSYCGQLDRDTYDRCSGNYYAEKYFNLF